MSDNNVLSDYARERLKAIHKLSLEYNGRAGMKHEERLLDLMRAHIEEIEELCAAGDQHALTETGDLIVLCLELIIEHGNDMDVIMDKCFGRYDKKLRSLLQDERKSGDAS